MPFVFIWILLEIAVFILVGEWIGVLWTIALIILTSLLGLIILRSQSFVVLKKMQEAMRKGKPPVFLDPDVPFIMLAGMLLLIPGFISDVIGLFFLIPAVPRLLFANHPMFKNQKKNKQDDAIDAEFWEEGKEPKELDKSNDKDKQDKS